jgi:hypothetical protein
LRQVYSFYFKFRNSFFITWTVPPLPPHHPTPLDLVLTSLGQLDCVTKTSYLNEKVSCTYPSRSVSVSFNNNLFILDVIRENQGTINEEEGSEQMTSKLR